MSKSVQLERNKAFQPLQQRAENLIEAIALQYKNDLANNIATRFQFITPFGFRSTVFCMTLQPEYYRQIKEGRVMHVKKEKIEFRLLCGESFFDCCACQSISEIQFEEIDFRSLSFLDCG